MDDRMDAVKAELEAVSFVGETLAPFFLQDPRTGTAGAAFQAVAQLRAQEAADAWPFADGAEARHALSLMVNGLADGIDADDLVWEYRRLFVGPAPKPAPPWGSVYTDRECVVFGEGTLELRAWMRAHGVRRTTDERTPEDQERERCDHGRSQQHVQHPLARMLGELVEPMKTRYAQEQHGRAHFVR